MAKKKAPAYGMKGQWIKAAVAANPNMTGPQIADLLNDKAKAEGYNMSFKAQDIYASKGKSQTKSKPASKPAKAAPASTNKSKPGKPDTVQALEQLRSLNTYFGGKAETKKVIDLLG